MYKYNNSEFSKKINSLIPGGAHTYSKGNDQFPSNAPMGIMRGKGAYVWDVEDRKFLDMTMGLTSVTLGHAYEEVLDSVREELFNGVNFQRPSYIELEYAECLKEILPEMDMFKFAKNGSTVTTAAVKLARGITGKDMVGVCAEQPFFSYDDWFIGSTVCYRGVPKAIRDLTFKFNYGDIESLKTQFSKYKGKIACIIMESAKWDFPPEGYFSKVRKLCDENNVIFILDEMITGFRYDFPGSYKKFGIKPDLMTFGKGIANGFSVAFLAGRAEIMEQGGINKKGIDRVFLVSTTHGAETHSLRAAIKTIDIYKSKNVVEHLHRIGNKIKIGSEEILRKHSMDKYINFQGYDCFLLVNFLDHELKSSLDFATLFRQEMIKNGILFQGTITVSYSHKDEEVEIFLKAFEKSLQVYKKAIEDGKCDKYLIGEKVKPVFRKRI